MSMISQSVKYIRLMAASFNHMLSGLHISRDIPYTSMQLPIWLKRGFVLQCIMRQLDSLHLKTAYENDQPAGLRIQVRQLMALQFAPIPLIRNTFNTSQSVVPPQLVPCSSTLWTSGWPKRFWQCVTCTRPAYEPTMTLNLILQFKFPSYDLAYHMLD